jgi:hypothetical protein
MAKRVIRLTEQELSKVLSDILNMTGVFGKKEKKDNKDTKGSEPEKSMGKVSAKGQELLNNPIFKEKLKEISSEIGVSESSIIKLMKHESGLDSSVKNSIGCVGLIQFCPDGKGGSGAQAGPGTPAGPGAPADRDSKISRGQADSSSRSPRSSRAS